MGLKDIDCDHVPVILTPGRYSLDSGKTWHTGYDLAKAMQRLEDRRRPLSIWDRMMLAAPGVLAILAGIGLFVLACWGQR